MSAVGENMAQSDNGQAETAIQPINAQSLQKARQLIAQGQLVVVPTDTVYGIACDPFNSAAIDKLFQVKRRPRSKSIQVLLPDLGSLDQLKLSLPQPLDVLSQAFLPGAFSPICQAEPTSSLATLRDELNPATGRHRLTQAVRVPDCAPLHQILSAVGPLAATSANLSGDQSATSAQQAYQALGEGVALYLDAGPTPGPVASTVVAADPAAADGIDILREGVIDAATIRAALPTLPVSPDPAIADPSAPVTPNSATPDPAALPALPDSTATNPPAADPATR